MTRTVTRRPARSGVASRFLQFLVLKAEERAVKTRHEKLRDDTLMAYTIEHGIADDKGHLVVNLDEPVTVGGTTYIGFMRQRKAPLQFNQDKAEALLKKKSLYEKALSTEVYLDQDKIYALQQTGDLTEKELDSMFEVKESFAFVPIKE